METFTIDDTRTMFDGIAEMFDRQCEKLCEMDAMMGDGDLGLTMKKGFAVCAETIRQSQDTNPGKAIMMAGMKMSSAVPSTMGTLMSSGLMTGGKIVADKFEWGSAEFAAFLDGFCAGVAKRGKCAPGDRTIYDALYTASEHARQAQKAGENLDGVAKAAWEGALEGIESTKQMMPKYGKAAVFSEKAIGHADQGAVAAGLLMEAMYRSIHTKYQ